MHDNTRARPASDGVRVSTDSRGRLNLKPFGPLSDSYLAHVDADGTIVLKPLVMMPADAARELERLRAELAQRNQATEDLEQPRTGDDAAPADALGSGGSAAAGTDAAQ